MSVFSAATRRWMAQSFDAPTQAQARGWAVIASGQHALITAPTGSGKTLAAFLWAIDRLMRGAAGGAADPQGRGGASGVQVLYVSPLKALVYDIERNLRAPLVGIARAAEALGEPLSLPRVGVRTGDTPARERQAQLKSPPEILVTTPESLYLLLGSRAAATLTGVHTLIVDEVHALAPTKRGAHLALSLERLAERCARDPQRIGLSATMRPLAEAASFLGGDRAVVIVDASAPPRLDLRVQVPVSDMENPLPAEPPRDEGGPILGELATRARARPAGEKGMWAALHPALLAEIQSHRSTIVFVNSRGLCERLCRRLNELAEPDSPDPSPEHPPLVRAHHGSVSHQQRALIEEGLKRGELKAIVATSSLEMGIDMGGVDQVLLVESPGSVARGLQRVGRAGHGVGQVSSGRIFPKFRGDLLECAVIATRMLSGELESFRMPRNALDVLAQQVAAHCVERERDLPGILRLVTRAGPYRELSRAALESVLDMLAGRYPSTDFAELRPLLVWDRATDTLSARKGTAMITRLNGGTIPDRGAYAVHLGEGGPRIGELDEEMVFETKAGDCILLGASTWRVESITRDRVLVTPAPGEPGKLPFWRGDGLGRPLELGWAIGAFTRRVAAASGERAIEWILEQTPLDRLAAENLAAYIQDQRAATGLVPSDRTLVVERFRDELGDWRICILTPFGARVHAPWAMALQWHLERREGCEIQVMSTDDGILLRLADGETLPDLMDLLPTPDELEERVTEQLAASALFASLFRENAARALLLPRRSAAGRRPLWAQRLKAQHLLGAVRRYPSFPIVLETYRQALSDVFDLAGLKEILQGIQSRAIRVHEVTTNTASPFARSLVFAYVAAYLYEQDAPLAERRAQTLALDRELLAELLGQAELRELIDPAVLQELESELQQTAEGRRAGDADALHDLLRRLGDLDAAELVERCVGDPVPWVDRLLAQRRLARLRFPEGPRWIAAEDAGLYRDALGLVPPPGLPERFIAMVDAPLEQLLRRYARTRGPFTTQEAAARYGLRPSQIEPVLRLLETRGELVHGEIRPLGSAPEWCDAEVLRRLRRRTLAKARDAVAPVDAATLGRFLPAWHGIGEDLGGADRLMESLIQLEGLRVLWSQLDTVLLPERVVGYRSEDLDMLAATGQIVWVGCGAAGPRDGRIAIYRRGSPLLGAMDGVCDPADAPVSEVGRVWLEHLERHGASFLMELTLALERAGWRVGKELCETSLWDLVWSGLITNDTFAPLRALSGVGRPRRGRMSPLAGGRWSLVASLVRETSDTERLLARARILLERYGVVTREVVLAEGLSGGFGPYYRILKEMEEAGQARRGYFVEGLSGAQFGLAAAVERLRAARLEEIPIAGFDADAVRVLAALDPANPYGALLPWPAVGGGAAPKRVSGARLILVAGKPVFYLWSSGRQLTSFPDSPSDQGGELALAALALARLARIGRRRIVIERIDGQQALGAPLRTQLLAAGFEPTVDALVPGRGYDALAPRARQ
ncbi:MAG: DEAD/DEAH box helicase [Sphingobacteriia bacterium]|nr:DEAD/DEAH box helicase [Sphingobacteriia bacterium]NCC38597.1 DEAD/DEAH box helicase [Gammaproteobacteria bacterium]